MSNTDLQGPYFKPTVSNTLEDIAEETAELDSGEFLVLYYDMLVDPCSTLWVRSLLFIHALVHFYLSMLTLRSSLLALIAGDAIQGI